MHSFQRAAFHSQECPRPLQGFSKLFWLCCNYEAQSNGGNDSVFHIRAPWIHGSEPAKAREAFGLEERAVPGPPPH